MGTFKNHFSFPYSHTIGVGFKDKIFQTETDLKNFIEIDKNALNMWVDHPWLQAAANIYNINIQILTTGIETPRWTRLQPTLQLKDATINDKFNDMYLLHANDSHFDLLVPKDILVLTEEEQEWMENQINLVESESRSSEVEILRYELAESKKQITKLQALVQELASKTEPSHVLESNSNSQKDIIFENHCCVECGKIFATFTKLEHHVKHEHQPNKTYNCTTYQKKYSSKENLWSHISDEHRKEYNCDSCEETFDSEDDFITHSDSDHNTEFNCDQCDYQDTTKLFFR